jgi:hypothetical protein
MRRASSRELSQRVVLSRLVAAAIAGVFPAGCGGETAASSPGKGAQDGGLDATAFSDGSAAQDGGLDAAPSVDGDARDGAGTWDGASCPGIGAVVSISPSLDAAAPDADTLWAVTYAVDPTCCGPQLRSALAWGVGAPELEGTCGYTMEVPCGAASATNALCPSWCQAVPAPVPPAWAPGCTITVGDAGSASVWCQDQGSGCGLGRPPRGFVARRVQAASALARKLAWMAQLEAASVVAFEALHADLARLGAPRALLRSVKRAARDEVRHARAAAREAGRLGARVPRVEVAAIPRRSSERLAIDNAGEGCVRETFGAALAAVQSRMATDGRVRAMMATVARDELRHAALSWRIARWLEPRLDRHGRGRVRQARRSALVALRRELAGAAPADLPFGSPGHADQRRLLAALMDPLERGWAA